MLKTDNSVKITLELSQETNLNELLAHLYLVQENIPKGKAGSDLLADFSIHEGELESLKTLNSGF